MATHNQRDPLYSNRYICEILQIGNGLEDEKRNFVCWKELFVFLFIFSKIWNGRNGAWQMPVASRREVFSTLRIWFWNISQIFINGLYFLIYCVISIYMRFAHTSKKKIRGSLILKYKYIIFKFRKYWIVGSLNSSSACSHPFSWFQFAQLAVKQSVQGERGRRTMIQVSFSLPSKLSEISSVCQYLFICCLVSPSAYIWVGANRGFCVGKSRDVRRDSPITFILLLLPTQYQNNTLKKKNIKQASKLISTYWQSYRCHSEHFWSFQPQDMLELDRQTLTWQ